jgi:hypothetical protein
VARIQVMHLPDDAFMLVIDQAPADGHLMDPRCASTLEAFADMAGAAGILMTQDTLDVV